MENQYTIGSTVFENWTIKRKIGEGSFGKVYEIEREDFGETYKAALKIITVPQSESELRAVMDTDGMTIAQAEDYFYSVVSDIVKEFSIMSKLKGTANIVSYEDHKVIQHTDGIGWDILIRMEYLTPFSQYVALHPFRRRDVIQLGIDICKALELCQKANIIHRDIKPENIMVSANGDFKLGDFGIARTIEKTSSGLSKKGTYTYMAPEVFKGEEYGFTVDLYSLGIVLYKLLNKDRTPFLPAAPAPILYKDKESAQEQRMKGEEIPLPFYGDGRLGEIVLKACAYQPKERYTSPLYMRKELEALLYDKDSELSGYLDEVILEKEQIPEQKQFTSETATETDVKVQSKNKSVASYLEESTDGTKSVFDAHAGKLEKVKSAKQPKQTAKASDEKKSSTKFIVIGVVLAVCLAVGLWQMDRMKTEKYQQLITDGMANCAVNPQASAEMFLEAQKLKSKEASAYTSYAYALYCMGEYDQCVTYVEDELALGKHFDIEAQNNLNEILAASYFELGDYAAAAAFFRTSTAGGDITVSAMRDYAVSLGRLGDVEAADEVLQRMYAAGADSDATDYVQAEVDFALGDYLAAEKGFQAVLHTTEDTALQRRALRSLAEVYRECSALSRTNASPIAYPATKEAALLADGIVKYGLQYDSTLWEMLGLAYYEAYRTDASTGSGYLTKAAECFNRVIELGVDKSYLYGNLYSIYYELHDFNTAQTVLNNYETAYPKDYMPHALRGMLYITMENQKAQSARNYNAAYNEYVKAGEKITSASDTTYYQQLGTLIQKLKNEGWL